MTVVIRLAEAGGVLCRAWRCMAQWPSPSGSPTTLELVCADARARHQRIRVQLAAVQQLMGALTTDDPTGLDIAIQVEHLAVLLERHCAHEEQILWPALALLAEAVRQGQPRPPLPFPTLLHPVRWMEGQHAQLREHLDGLRQQADARTPPRGTAEPWRRFRDGLAALDAAVADHSHFENEVLYPEALEVERRLG